MFFCPYFHDNFRTSKELSYVRVLHACTDGPAVDVYANGKMIARGIRFKQFSEYMPVAPGDYKILVFVAGTKTNPIINQTVIIPENSVFTAAVVGTLSNVFLDSVPDSKVPINVGKTMLRFVNFSPNSPALDLEIKNERTIFKEVTYREITGYNQLSPGTYNFNLRPTGGDKNVLVIPKITLKPNKFYTIYTIGLIKGIPPLQVVIPLDGGSYLRYK